MSIRKSVDAEEVAKLMFGQFIISVILAAINAGIVGWKQMGGAFISQPEVIMWYYTSASFLVFVFYMVLTWAYWAIFEDVKTGGQA